MEQNRPSVRTVLAVLLPAAAPALGFQRCGPRGVGPSGAQRSRWRAGGACWLVCLLSAAACSVALADIQDPHAAEAAGPVAPGTIPADAVIGRISVRIADIFDLSDPREDRVLYRVANALHRRTREDAIRSQLLFAPGEPFSPRKLEETERTLRANGYLAEAVVRPAATHGNEVDVEVAVRDVWTLSPDVSFGRQGGRNKSAVSIEDPNLLGLGKSVKFEHGSDFDRTSTTLQALDPNLFGSRWRLGLGYSDNSDGHAREVAFGRPFFAFDTPWSFGFDYLEDDRESPRYALGHEVDRFRFKHDQVRVEGGFSKGYEQGWTRRWLIGVTKDDSRFYGAAADPAMTLNGETPIDRHYLYPWVGWEIMEDDYAETTNLSQIGRVEDLYLGTSARVELGVSPPREGTRSTALFATRARTALAWDDGGQVLQLAADASGRYGADGLENSLLNARGEYFRRSGEKHLWYARLGGSLAENLDPQTQLLLGGDNGLRGYPLRYQGGTASALLTLEHRYFTDWYPLRLARVGGAVFFDMGRTWGNDVVGTQNLGWLKDVGVGLRLGNARSSHGSVIHLDVAFPLDGTDDINSLQFLISTRKSF